MEEEVEATSEEEDEEGREAAARHWEEGGLASDSWVS